jgi:hypothetical protein
VGREFLESSIYALETTQVYDAAVFGGNKESAVEVK